LIQPFLKNVKCSVVSANIKPDHTLAAELSGSYSPYKIIDVGPEKVAVVGYTTAETPVLSMPGKVKFCCFVEALKCFLQIVARCAQRVIALHTAESVTP